MVVVMWGSGIHQEKWNPKIKLANTTKKRREIVQTDKFVDEIDERRNLFLIQYGLVIYRFQIKRREPNMVNCKKRKNMTGTVDNAVEEIKNFFHTLQTSENWFRFGVTFSTQEKYYFLDTGTGKIFRVNQQVYL